MKKIKKLTAIVLVLVMALAFSGCGKMTAEQLAAKMAVAVAKSPMTQEKIQMEFEMGVGARGITLNFDVDMAMDMLMSVDPYKAYTELEISMDMLGQNYTDTMQLYVQEADGTMTTYSYIVSADRWDKQTAQIPEEQYTANYDWLKNKPAAELTLAEETQTISGREAYVLSCTITGTQMQEMMKSIGAVQGALDEAGMSNFDMSAVTVPMVMYIDTQNYLPMQMELEIQGLDEMIEGMMEGLLGEDAAEIGMELEIGKITVVCTDIGYDAVMVPEVPQEALSAE